MTPNRETHSDQPSRRRVIKVAGAAVVGTTLSTAPAAANHNTPPQGIFGDGFDVSGNTRAFFSGVRSGYGAGLSSPPRADTLADRAINEFTANEGAWIDYGDWLAQEHGLSPLGDATITVGFEITRGRWPTRDEAVDTTLETKFDTETNSYTSVDWRREAADDPDYEAILQNQAAENASDELTSYRREFIGDPEADEPDHELPPDAYLAALTGRYWSAIRLGEDTEHVLQLLLGDIDG